MHDKKGKTLNTMLVTTDPGLTLYSSLTSRTALCPAGGGKMISTHGQTPRAGISSMDLRNNSSIAANGRAVFAQPTPSPFFESKRNSKRTCRKSYAVSEECPKEGPFVSVEDESIEHEQAPDSSSSIVPDKESRGSIFSQEVTKEANSSDKSSTLSSTTSSAPTQPTPNSSALPPSTISTTPSSFLSPSSIPSASSVSSKPPTPSTSQSLPIVSVNELQGVEVMGHGKASDSRPVKVTHFTIFTEYHQHHHQLRQPMGRPHTAGPRALVSPEHTGPVGLGKEDVVRGMKFGSYIEDHFYYQDTKREDKSDDNENDKTKTGSVGPVSCGEYFLRKNVPEEKMEFHNREKLDGNGSTRPKSDYGRLHKRLHRPLCRSAIQGERTVSLELTITSIATGNRFTEENERQDEENTGQGQQRGAIPAATNRKQTGSGKDGEFNTIDGIRRSYRRAQSAPPISRSAVTSCFPPNDTRASENKTFSSLYWRAKSAYHRRNIDSNSEGNIGEDNEDPERCPSSQFRGSLLRPLLYTEANSHMKHSAGCPYKCKSCFKACLVSEDYVQQAKEWYRQNKVDSLGLTTKNPRAERSHPPRKNNAIAIVNRALARSQPLFAQVYGPGERTKVKAWPQYGWVDIKQQVKIPESKEQQVCGEVSSCNGSTGHCISSTD